MNNSDTISAHQRINQTSGDVEYYTPSFIIEAAREVMGGIELDPATSEKANEIVRAETIFTKEYDGFNELWIARSIWMNHPFGKGEYRCPEDRSKCAKKTCRDRGFHCEEWVPGNKDWIKHFITATAVHKMCITFASTSEGWFQPLLKVGMQCWLSPRTNYYLPDGSVKKGVTKGSVVTYIGPNKAGFKNVFSRYGVVK